MFFTGRFARRSAQPAFAHGSFVDEIAAEVKADPVAHRLRHLRDPRLVDVVKAGEAASWEAAASPRRPATDQGRGGRGISVLMRRRQRILRDGRRGRYRSGHGPVPA
jgi:hypothetical protein